MTEYIKTGYAHKTNFLKFRILETLYRAYITDEGPLTTFDIERITGIDRHKIKSAMYHYQNIKKRNGTEIKLPYITRLPKRVGRGGAYRYKITKKGIAAYFDYLARIKRGVSLNRVGESLHKPKHMETYGKYPAKIKTEEDQQLLPEQLLPYYSLTTYALQEGITRKTIILQTEERVRQFAVEEAEATAK